VSWRVLVKTGRRFAITQTWAYFIPSVCRLKSSAQGRMPSVIAWISILSLFQIAILAVLAAAVCAAEAYGGYGYSHGGWVCECRRPVYTCVFCVRFCVRFPVRDCAATSAKKKSAQSRTEKRIHLRFRGESSFHGPSGKKRWTTRNLRRSYIHLYPFLKHIWSTSGAHSKHFWSITNIKPDI
jgi:hypothetical protein